MLFCPSRWNSADSVRPGAIGLFFGLDDDAEDAGGANAEDKLEVKFKVFPARQERVYDFAQGDWSIRVHYTLAK